MPQYEQWRFLHAMAWTDTAQGRHPHRRPRLPRVAWRGRGRPRWSAGCPTCPWARYTGQYQAGWNVAGTDDYIVYGGEFPTVNGVGQQGLVRFARTPIAPARQGPQFTGGAFIPRLVPTSSSTLRVSWAAGYDRDDLALGYRVIRNGAFGTPQAHHDEQLELVERAGPGVRRHRAHPGADLHLPARRERRRRQHRVRRQRQRDDADRLAASTAYSQAVRADGARIYWPMNETSGLQVTDRAAGTAATVRCRGHRRPRQHRHQLEPARGHHRRHRGAADRQRLEPRLRPRHRDGSGHLHDPGVGAYRDDARWTDPRLRRPAVRQLRPPRPPPVDGRRGAHQLRRTGAGQHDARGHQRGRLQQQPVAHAHRDDELGRACGSTSTASSWASAPTPRPARPTSGTGASVATGSPCLRHPRLAERAHARATSSGTSTRSRSTRGP